MSRGRILDPGRVTLDTISPRYARADKSDECRTAFQVLTKV